MTETGTVRRWWQREGFGFVQRDNGEPELYARGPRNLRAGQRVQFAVERQENGLLRAVDVKPAQ